MAPDIEASCENDPNFAVICAFMEKFGKQCGLPPIEISKLQDMIENTEEVPQPLEDFITNVLKKVKRGWRPGKWEKALVGLCHNYSKSDAWEIERFGFKKANLSAKVRAIKELLEMLFDYYVKFKNEINKLAAKDLRSQPLGHDRAGNAYWFQSDQHYQIRVYKQDVDEEMWTLIAKDRESLVGLITKLSDSDTKFSSDSAANEDSNSLSDKPIIDIEEEHIETLEESEESTDPKNSGNTDDNESKIKTDYTKRSRSEDESDRKVTKVLKIHLTDYKKDINLQSVLSPGIDCTVSATKEALKKEGGDVSPKETKKGALSKKDKGISKNESPIIGEAIEEETLYVEGEGSGAECESGIAKPEEEKDANEQVDEISAPNKETVPERVAKDKDDLYFESKQWIKDSADNTKKKSKHAENTVKVPVELVVYVKQLAYICSSEEKGNQKVSERHDEVVTNASSIKYKQLDQAGVVREIISNRDDKNVKKSVEHQDRENTSEKDNLSNQTCDKRKRVQPAKEQSEKSSQAIRKNASLKEPNKKKTSKCEKPISSEKHVSNAHSDIDSNNCKSKSNKSKLIQSAIKENAASNVENGSSESTNDIIVEEFENEKTDQDGKPSVENEVKTIVELRSTRSTKSSKTEISQGKELGVKTELKKTIKSAKHKTVSEMEVEELSPPLIETEVIIVPEIGRTRGKKERKNASLKEQNKKKTSKCDKPISSEKSGSNAPSDIHSNDCKSESNEAEPNESPIKESPALKVEHDSSKSTNDKIVEELENENTNQDDKPEVSSVEKKSKVEMMSTRSTRSSKAEISQGKEKEVKTSIKKTIKSAKHKTASEVEPEEISPPLVETEVIIVPEIRRTRGKKEKEATPPNKVQSITKKPKIEPKKLKLLKDNTLVKSSSQGSKNNVTSVNSSRVSSSISIPGSLITVSDVEKDPVANSGEDIDLTAEVPLKPTNINQITFHLKDSTTSPPLPVIPSSNKKEEEEEVPNSDGKKMKLKGKGQINAKLRKIIEQQKEQVSGSDEVIEVSDTVKKKKSANPPKSKKLPVSVTSAASFDRGSAPKKSKQAAQNSGEQADEKKQKPQKPQKDVVEQVKKQKEEVIPEKAIIVKDTLKKKKKKQDFTKFHHNKPWQWSSDSSEEEWSSDSSEEEEEETTEEEPIEDEPSSSDHEFSPESEGEDDEVQAPKSARTARKTDVFDEKEEEPVDEVQCQKCSKSDHPEWILLCDNCDNGSHCSCLRPPLLSIPKGKWFCPPCQHEKLIENLELKLNKYDKLLRKKQLQDRRMERLECGYTSNIVLRTRRHSSAMKSEDSESDSVEPIDKLRLRKQARPYKLNMAHEPAPQGRGKGIVTIVRAEQDKHKEKGEKKIGENVENYEKPTAETQAFDKTKEDSEGEPIKPPVRNLRKKGRKMCVLDVSSEDDDERNKDFEDSSWSSEGDDSAEEYGEDRDDVSRKRRKNLKPVRRYTKRRMADDKPKKDSEDGLIKAPVRNLRRKGKKMCVLDVSSEDDDERNKDFKDSSWSSGGDDSAEEYGEDRDDVSRKRRKNLKPVRRSTKTRVGRFDQDFINGDDEYDDAPTKKQKRNHWSDFESSELDSWGRSKKKNGCTTSRVTKISKCAAAEENGSSRKQLYICKNNTKEKNAKSEDEESKNETSRLEDKANSPQKREGAPKRKSYSLRTC